MLFPYQKWVTKRVFKQKRAPIQNESALFLIMREKGVEPSLRWNWCLKPARLPFRHSRTETSFIVTRFAAKVNCRVIILSFLAHNNPKNSKGGPRREEKAPVMAAVGRACGGVSAVGPRCGSGLAVQQPAGPGLSGTGTGPIAPPLPVGRAAERPWEPERRQHRSEERRVGKECRSRWSPYH